MEHRRTGTATDSGELTAFIHKLFRNAGGQRGCGADLGGATQLQLPRLVVVVAGAVIWPSPTPARESVGVTEVAAAAPRGREGDGHTGPVVGLPGSDAHQPEEACGRHQARTFRDLRGPDQPSLRPSPAGLLGEQLPHEHCRAAFLPFGTALLRIVVPLSPEASLHIGDVAVRSTILCTLTWTEGIVTSSHGG